MQVERNALHADVFPYLTDMCRMLGLQFEPSDMVGGEKEREGMCACVCSACLLGK